MGEGDSSITTNLPPPLANTYQLHSDLLAFQLCAVEFIDAALSLFGGLHGDEAKAQLLGARLGHNLGRQYLRKGWGGWGHS